MISAAEPTSGYVPTMPIVDIELIGSSGIPIDLPQLTADAIGRVLEAPPGTTWVRARFLPASLYAESGGELPSDVEPVFVTILQRRRPTGAGLAGAVAAVTEAVAEITGRASEHVHIVFEEDGAGRVAFGGEIVL